MKKVSANLWKNHIKYSTHQAIKNTPLVCVYSYGATCLIATCVTF